jgi:hypothetical protein
MRANEAASPPASAPHELAGAVVELLGHAVAPDAEIDPVLLGLLRRFAAAIVAVDLADAIELAERDELGPGEFPIGIMADGSVTAGIVPGAVPLATLATGTTPDEARVAREMDDSRQGRDFAVALGVDVPEGSMRFRMRSGVLDPTRIDVYDEQGERCAIITETRDGTEWRCSVLTAREARSMDTISFPRAVEHLDAVLDEVPAGDR